MQYCTASTATKFIPYTASLYSRCGNECHRYCEHFLSRAQSERGETLRVSVLGGGNGEAESVREHWVAGIRLPATLCYSHNHMWLDLSNDGYCHVGVDAFVARVLGGVEKMSFVGSKGFSRPTVVLTARGIDWQMTFPNPIWLTEANIYLRVSPAKLIADPYGAGWLFEGLGPASSKRNGEQDLCAGLLCGAEAIAWMKQELHRLREFLHAQLPWSKPSHDQTDAETWLYADGVAPHLDREACRHLFNTFFSLSAPRAGTT